MQKYRPRNSCACVSLMQKSIQGTIMRTSGTCTFCYVTPIPSKYWLAQLGQFIWRTAGTCTSRDLTPIPSFYWLAQFGVFFYLIEYCTNRNLNFTGTIPSTFGTWLVHFIHHLKQNGTIPDYFRLRIRPIRLGLA